VVVIPGSASGAGINAAAEECPKSGLIWGGRSPEEGEPRDNVRVWAVVKQVTRTCVAYVSTPGENKPRNVQSVVCETRRMQT